MTYRHPPANTTEPGVITLAGDLGGTEASPSVLKINGISVSSSASANQVLVTTSSSATTWAQIVNAYVSNTAAIAGSKISPDFGSQNIVTTGTLSVGGATVTSLQDTGLGTGVVHSDSSGNFTSSLIVNTDVSSSAAIAGSKISPNFGTQALTAGTFSLGTTTSVNSISGSLTYTVKTFSGTGTIDTTTNDLIVYADTSSAPFTLTLPAPTSGRFLIIKDKKQTFATNNLTIAPHGSEKIDGSASNLVLNVSNLEVIFTSDGTDWYTNTGVASTSGPAGGDLSGTYPNPTVAKINGASVPAAGSLTTGNVLQVSGSSSLTYGPVNLGGGSNYVSGVLPAGNQAAQTMGGDVTGTTAASTVVSLTGTTGTVSTASSTTTIQFNASSSSANINQAATSSASGQTFTINAQNATGASHNGGNLILAGGTSGSATAGNVQLQTGGSTRLTVQPGGTVTIANLGTGVVHADSSGNLTSSAIVDTDVASNAAIAVSKLAAGTAGQVLISNSTPTPTWTTLTSDVTVTSGGATTVNSISGSSPIAITPAELQWASGTTTPKLDQASTSSASGTTLTIQAQSATGASNNGGQLILAGGTSGSATAGTVVIQTGGSTRLTAGATGVITIANLGTGVVHADSSGNLTSSLIVNADVSNTAAIAYSKLNLSNSIVNADINASAAIAYSKLNLTGSIVNADISATAAIAGSKISPNFGTQALTAGTFALGTSTSVNSLNGSITFTTKTFSSTGTIDTSTTDMLIYADTSGGAFNLTLPAPTTGRTLIVKDKKQTFATNNLTIVRNGSEKIDGVAASLILATNNEEVIFTSDGTDWYTSLFAESTTGAAGGDLSGTYPNPTVAKVNGVSYPSSPSTNTVPVVTSSNTVTYQQIADAQVSSSAAISVSKLAAGTAGQVLLNNSTPTPTWTTLTSDVTVSSTGVTTVNSISGSSPIAITPANLQWTAGTSSPTINQASPSATNTPAAGQTLLINSQAGTAAVSGNNSGGAGGIAELLGGTGGTPTGTATGGNGGVSEVVGGTGGMASSTSGSTGGNGGQAELLGGTGGAGNGAGTTGGTGGAITIDAGAGGAAGGGTAGGNGGVSIGATNAASIGIGRSGITTTVTGGLTQLTGAVSLTGNATSSFTTSSGALTLTSAATATWSTSAGTLSLSGNTGTNLQTNAVTIAKVDANKFYAVKGYNQNVTPVVHSNSPYTVQATDNIIATDSTSGTITITLPTSPAVGDTYQIKDVSGQNATNNTTVDSGTNNVIDGAQTFVMDINYDAVTLVCTSITFNTSHVRWSIL